MKCNNLNHLDYKFLQGSSYPWFCISCCNKIVLFGTLANKTFYLWCLTLVPLSLKTTILMTTNINSTSLVLKPSANLSLYFNQFNNFSPNQRNKPEYVVNSNYYDFDQLQTLDFHEKNNSLSLFYINACSLSKKFDDLEHLLKCTSKVFDIVAVSETRITGKTSLEV